MLCSRPWASRLQWSPGRAVSWRSHSQRNEKISRRHIILGLVNCFGCFTEEFLRPVNSWEEMVCAVCLTKSWMLQSGKLSLTPRTIHFWHYELRKSIQRKSLEHSPSRATWLKSSTNAETVVVQRILTSESPLVKQKSLKCPLHKIAWI